jgi:ketosteroid isomerase-like protein
MKQTGTAWLVLLALLRPAPLGAAKDEDVRAHALLELVEVERAFAEHAQKTNWVEAFTAFFAEDGLMFTPQPQPARPLLARIPEADAVKDRVSWFPVVSDASRAGDLGWNAGPYSWAGADKPARHGTFFTIWKRDAENRFRVAIDFGAPRPEASTETPRDWRPRPSSGAKARRGDESVNAGTLKAREAELCAATRASGLAAGYAKLLEREPLLLRESRAPLRDEAAVRAYLDGLGTPGPICFDPQAAGLARSKDLGYTYGSYLLMLREGAAVPPSVHGYYVHVWRRDGKGHWKLAAEVLNTEKPKAPVPDAAAAD